MARLCWIWLVFMPFIAMGQDRYCVIISEIMADPSPVVNLPNVEWIELKNISVNPVNLLGWRIADQTGVSGPMGSFILKPDSLVILCTSSAISQLSVFGTCLPVTSFPSLDNDGDLLSLRSLNGQSIHAVHYNVAWYGNELKQQGGWSLEIKDHRFPCSGELNWAASNDNKGGTPGQPNSGHEPFTDNDGPILINSRAINPSTIVIGFDEPVDSLSAALPGLYSIDKGVTISKALPLAPLFNEVQLSLNSPLQEKIIYSFSAAAIPDCKGNIANTIQNIRAGLPSPVEKQDIIINEILFNPKPGGYDFIEFYNKSNKIIDASSIFIANRNSNNIISSITKISTGTFYIFPGDHFVITENKSSLRNNFWLKNEGAVIELSSLPSFPDDKGFVILLDKQGETLDEVNYTDDWHFKLLPDKNGVSLERINPAGPSQDPLNWHSAASTSGYGTPGYRNSQFLNADPSNSLIEVSPAVFSPDNDGLDDLLSIHYKMPEPGWVASVIIYDVNGRPVKTLARGVLLGLEGNWNWDGLSDNHQSLPLGIYIIYSDLFNLSGKKKQFKKTVVLARKI